jgi:phosphate transport system substrate-binding protein
MARHLWCLVLASALSWAGCSNSDSTGGGTSGSGDGTTVSAGWKPEGAILPTTETIESGEYKPLSRPLFIYVNAASLKKPAVAAFVDYFMSPAGQELVAETGYNKLSAAQFAAARKTFDDALATAGVAEIPESADGDVVIDGSSTVQPITTAVAEEFSKLHKDARVPVGTSGTGGGFKAFSRGDTDISNASRPIKDSEAAACAEAGIEYIELPIAIDGLTVVVNPENTWCDGLTVAQLKQIWEPDSKVSKWSDLRPEWPAEPIKLFGPDADSGTFDYFTEVVCGEVGKIRTDYQPSTDDNVLVTGVNGDSHALGYFGYAYYIENQERVKAIAIAPAAKE